MIARPALSAHVCFRCQVWLSKQLTAVNTNSSDRTRPPRGARLLHDEAAPEISEEAGGFKVRRTALKPEVIYRRIYLANRLSERPMGRLHGFRGYQVREKYQPLAVDTLGNQSEVIVLRDSGLIYSAPPEIEAMAAEKVDILARVDAERGLPSEVEITRNIDEVRPQTHLLNTEEFKAVELQLNDGFIASQLVKYIESFGRNQEKRLQDAPAALSKDTLWTLGWMPGISASPDVFDEDPLRGYISDAYTPKQRLVLHILRQYWDVEVTEVTESLGEIELHIDPLKLELLIKGKTPPLRMVSDNLISTEDEKIEAFRSRSVIRITAAKVKATHILQAIQEELGKFCSIEVDLAPFSPGPQTNVSKSAKDLIGDADIAELGRISATEIRKLKDNKLEISCINDDSEVHLSTPVDVARRYLLASVDAWHNSFKQVRFQASPEPMTAVKYEQTENMPWRDRLHSWVRWMSPVSKPKSDDCDNEKKSIKMKTGPESIRLRKTRLDGEDHPPFPISMSQKELDEDHFANVVAKPRGYIFWDHKYFTTTSVIVGHILHRVDSNIPTASKPAGNITRFIPSALNVSKLFSKSNPKHLQERKSVVMRFRPSPWTSSGGESLAKFPQVEMRFHINPETRTLELKDVFALAEVATSDIMVPDRALDLRFQQRTTSRLRELHYHTLPQIKDFLAISQLDTTLGPLKTPPSIILPIAQHLVGPKSSPNVTEATETPSDVQYLFAGLEFRTTLAVPFKNWRLLYTSIDGGKGEGRRTEVSLRPRRARRRDEAIKESGPDSQDAMTQDFIDTAYHLLDVLEDGRDPIRQVRGTPKVVRLVPAELDPSRQHVAAHPFKYFSRTITFTGRPGEDELTTSKEDEDEEEVKP